MPRPSVPSPATPIRSIGVKTKTKKIKSVSKLSTGDKPKRRYKPGTVANREILKYQRSTKPLCRRVPFERLVRERANAFEENLHFQRDALAAIQEASEAHMIRLFAAANRIARYAKREAVTGGDFKLAIELTEAC